MEISQSYQSVTTERLPRTRGTEKSKIPKVCICIIRAGLYAEFSFAKGGDELGVY